MTNVRKIRVDWHGQQPPRFNGGPQLAYQGDHLSNMVVFDNAPELPNYYLIVKMKTDDAGPVDTLPAIMLEGPYWVVPNYYTQICQQITYQVCCKTETGDYEHHSAEFKGTILPVLKHNGEPIDQSTMFDPYMNILDKKVSELIVAAGDIQIDSELKSDSGNPVQNRVIKAAIDGLGNDVTAVNGRLDEQGEEILELQDGGYIADQQQIATKINAWLNDHPEATTTVQDGAITEQKINPSFLLTLKNSYVTPEMYGAAGDGVTDDYDAIAACIATAKNLGLPVKITNNHYLGNGLTLNDVIIISDTKPILKFKNNITPLVTVESKVTIRNIRFENEAYNYDEEIKIIGVLIKGSHCRFDNVEVRNCFRGIEMGYSALNVAYNYFNRCYVLNCVEGIYIIATGTNGYTNEHVFNECTVRIDSNMRTVFTNLGLDDRYAITLERDISSSKNINCISFISCNVENCFNGFSVRAYYCMFLNCRTDNNNIYYYFHQTNGGYNTVICAWGTATDGGQQRIFEKLDNGNDNMNNFIQMRNYPLTIDMPRFGPHSTANRPTLASKDRGTCMFDITLNLPIWWTGSAWITADGTVV